MAVFQILKPQVHTMRFMRPCVTCVCQKSRISVVHRMYQIGLLSTFLCDSCIAGKSQQFLKVRDDELYLYIKHF